jgi:hypothetical protein
MSSTAKTYLHQIKDTLDRAFANASPADARDLTTEVREHLTLLNSAFRRSLHDTKTNAATDHAL